MPEDVLVHGPRAATVARQLFSRSPDWLRRLEYAGIIPPAPRDFSGRRCYPPEYLAEIVPIVMARRRREDEAMPGGA